MNIDEEIRQLVIRITADNEQALNKMHETSLAVKKLLGTTQEEYMTLIPTQSLEEARESLLGLYGQLDDMKTKLRESKKEAASLFEQYREAKQNAKNFSDLFNDGVMNEASQQQLSTLLKTASGLGAQWRNAKSAATSNAEVVAAINERIRETRSHINNLNKESEKTTNIVIKLGTMIKAMILRYGIRKLITAVTSSIGDALKALAKFDSSLGNIIGYNKAVSDLKSNFKQLSATMAITVGEITSILGPVLSWVITAVKSITETINKLIVFTKGLFNSDMTYTYFDSAYWEDYAKSMEKAEKAQRMLIGGFDELNRLSSNGSGSANGLNLEDWYKTRELTKEEQVAMGHLLGGALLLTPAIAALINHFKSKNRELGTQTDLTNLEASAVSKLSDEYENAGQSALGFGTVLSGVGAGALVTAIASIGNIRGVIQDLEMDFISAGQSVKAVFQSIGLTFKRIAENIGQNAQIAAKNVSAQFKSAFEGIGKMFDSILEWFKGIDWGAVLLGGTAIAGIIAALAIPGALPALIPAVGTGMALIPAAKGNVATKPTLTLSGEYTGASSNPEITSPRSIMKETVIDANSELAGVFIQAARSIVNAIDNKDMSISIGDETIGNSAARANDRYYKQTGQSLIKAY